MTTPGFLDLRGTVPGPEELAPVVAHLAAGNVIAYPTETVYGFGGLCLPGSVARVLGLKGRDAGRPLLVLARGAEQLSGLRWTDEARELASIFWPGAVTLVLGDPDGVFPQGVRSPAAAVAVRVSPHPLVAALLGLVEGPITSTSANAPGNPSACSGEEALSVAMSLGAGSGVLVVEGGVLPPSAPSTIIDCSGGSPVVLREGSVPLSRLRCALPDIHER